MKNKLIYIGHIVGYICMIIGAILQFNHIHIAPTMFTVGAVFSIAAHLFGLPQSDNFRIKRLNNLVLLFAIGLGIAIYLIWEEKNSWIIALTISIFIDLYTNFRYSKINNQNSSH